MTDANKSALINPRIAQRLPQVLGWRGLLDVRCLGLFIRYAQVLYQLRMPARWGYVRRNWASVQLFAMRQVKVAAPSFAGLGIVVPRARPAYLTGVVRAANKFAGMTAVPQERVVAVVRAAPRETAVALAPAARRECLVAPTEIVLILAGGLRLRLRSSIVLRGELPAASRMRLV